MEWNNLVVELSKTGSLPYFKNALLKVGWPTDKLIYNIYNCVSLKLLIRLRLGLNHLNEHKFKHNFYDCIIPLCMCS